MSDDVVVQTRGLVAPFLAGIILATGCGGGKAPPAVETVLEGWESVVSFVAWKAWDQTVTFTDESRHHTEGIQACRLNFDFARYEWPMIYAKRDKVIDIRPFNSIKLDVYVPPGMGLHLTVTVVVYGLGNNRKTTSPTAGLKEGWNTAVFDLSGKWMNNVVKQSVISYELVIGSTDKRKKGWVVLDNFRCSPGKN